MTTLRSTSPRSMYALRDRVRTRIADEIEVLRKELNTLKTTRQPQPKVKSA